MASLKVIRKRISSVRNTQQVTKAMKMVSAAKLRRAQAAAEAARAYSVKLTELLRGLATSDSARLHPFMQPGVAAPPHLVLITADKGLCGAYNANLIRMAASFLAGEQGRGARMTVIGRRGRDYFGKRDRGDVAAQHVNVPRTVDLARTVARDVSERFLGGEAGEVLLLYTRFRSAISQVATLERLLPLGGDEGEAQQVSPREYVYEPSAEAILESLLLFPKMWSRKGLYSEALAKLAARAERSGHPREPPASVRRDPNLPCNAGIHGQRARRANDGDG